MTKSPKNIQDLIEALAKTVDAATDDLTENKDAIQTVLHAQFQSMYLSETDYLLQLKAGYVRLGGGAALAPPPLKKLGVYEGIFYADKTIIKTKDPLAPKGGVFKTYTLPPVYLPSFNGLEHGWTKDLAEALYSPLVTLMVNETIDVTNKPTKSALMDTTSWFPLTKCALTKSDISLDQYPIDYVLVPPSCNQMEVNLDYEGTDFDVEFQSFLTDPLPKEAKAALKTLIDQYKAGPEVDIEQLSIPTSVTVWLDGQLDAYFVGKAKELEEEMFPPYIAGSSENLSSPTVLTTQAHFTPDMVGQTIHVDNGPMTAKGAYTVTEISGTNTAKIDTQSGANLYKGTGWEVNSTDKEYSYDLTKGILPIL